MRMKLKRANTTEVKREEREFKKRQQRNAKARKRYAEKHPPKKSRNGTYKYFKDIEKDNL